MSRAPVKGAAVGPHPKPPYKRKGTGKDKFGRCRQCGERITFDTDRHGHHIAISRDRSLHPCEDA